MDRKSFIIVALGVAVFALAAQPAPAAAPPEVIVKTVEVPGPQPTPQVITKTVEVPVVPQACLDGIDKLLDAYSMATTLNLDVFDAYLDYPDENLGEFGQRVEQILDKFSNGPEFPDWDTNPCFAPQPAGSSS